ncbi:MAG: stage II sporulation protein M [Bacteroidota bacterium]
MRETRFISQMKDKWKSFEEILKSPYKAPDKLYDVFINIMDDLSYARTFYPNRSVRVYLNGLAQKIFVNVYKNKKSERNRFVVFWTDTLPQLVYEARREFLLSFGVFLLAFLIGVISSVMDPDFAAVILGDSYVEMTKENIASGDPMAVYKQRGEFGMSFGIAGNNLFVAFLTFVLGIFFTIGSIGVLVSNGVMVGAFQYFFIERDLFWESFLTIWIHGTLEISAIVIAGAAGITMGKGLVFPGSYSRAKSFQKSARRGLKIMFGITPIIILAAFFEGYLTRHTEASFFIRGLFITINFLFIVGYFIIYPRWKARRGFAKEENAYQLQKEVNLNIEWMKIRNVSQLFGDTVILYRKYFRTIVLGSLLAAMLYTGITYFTAEEVLVDFYFPNTRFGTFSRLEQFFINPNWWMALAFLVPTTLLTILIFNRIHPEIDYFSWLNLKVIASILIIYISIYFLKAAVISLMFFLFPVLLLYAFVLYQEQLNIFNSIGRSFQLITGNYWKAVGLFALITLVSGFLFSILDTGLFGLFFDMLSWIFPFKDENLEMASTLSLIFIVAFALFLLFSLYFIGFMILYFSALESKDAVQLKMRIEEIGAVERIRGIERE